MSFHLHRWSRWSEIKAERIILRWLPGAEGVEYYQQRECSKCGRIQRKEVDER